MMTLNRYLTPNNQNWNLSYLISQEGDYTPENFYGRGDRPLIEKESPHL